MKHLLLSALLLAGFSSCKNGGSDPAPIDPLVGQWKAEAVRIVNYDANNVVFGDFRLSVVQQLDVTATTFTTTKTSNGGSYSEATPYTHDGETLKMIIKSGAVGETYAARNLTSTNFNFELTSPRQPSGAYYVETTYYHH